MNAALRIARHEWNLIFRDPRFLIPFFAAPVFLLVLHFISTKFMPFSPQEQWLLLRTFLGVLALIGASMSIPLGADTFAGEKERHTWETLLCLPLSRGQLFVGKVLGVLPFPLAVGWIGQTIALLFASQEAFGLPPTSWWLPSLIMTPFLTLFFCSLSVLISLRCETVRAAAQLTGLFLLVLFPLVTMGTQMIYDKPKMLVLVFFGLCLGSVLCLMNSLHRIRAY